MRSETCAPGSADCDGNPSNACETNVRLSRAHCGACGQTCAPGQGCVDGACRAVLSLSVGPNHVCAVLGSGKVRCWGDNGAGLLGDGTARMRLSPVEVLGVDDAIRVAALRTETCVLRATAPSVCWGHRFSDDAAARLGTPDSRTRPEFLEGAVALSELGNPPGQCALSATGQLRCFEHQSSSVFEVRSLDGVKSLAGSCAVLRSGRVSCLTKVDGPREDFVEARVGGVDTAASGDANERGGCALSASGSVRCWGRHAPTADEKSVDSAPIAGIADATQVVVGEGHACALRRTGSVVCWGDGRMGQLGDGAFQSSDRPVAVRGLVDAELLSAAGSTTCAARRSGKIACWGDNTSGQLGNGSGPFVAQPARVPALSDVTQLSTGANSNCALLRSGSIKCWGSLRDEPQLESKLLDLAPRVFAQATSPAAQIAAAGDDLCSIDRQGQLMCWSSLKQQPDPIARALPGAVLLSASERLGCAAFKDGSVRCWKIQYASDARVEPPFIVRGVRAPRSLAADNERLCAVLANGKLACGSTDEPHADRLKVVPGVEDAIQVAAMHRDVCVVLRSGAVLCGLERLVRVTGLEGVAQVAVGGHHVCARGRDGQVWCWGSGASGQLGLPLVDSTDAPRLVSGLGDKATQIAAGQAHTCALLADAQVSCWGANYSAELGRRTLMEGAPVDVVGP